MLAIELFYSTLQNFLMPLRSIIDALLTMHRMDWQQGLSQIMLESRAFLAAIVPALDLLEALIPMNKEAPIKVRMCY